MPSSFLTELSTQSTHGNQPEKEKGEGVVSEGRGGRKSGKVDSVPAVDLGPFMVYAPAVDLSCCMVTVPAKDLGFLVSIPAVDLSFCTVSMPPVDLGTLALSLPLRVA